MKVDVLILGAGPAGLAVAAGLKARGCTSFLVLEKEQEAGGLCRSAYCDGAPLDIGGGHILDVRNRRVLDFLFQYLPEAEWRLYQRHTNIVVGPHTVGYPLEANIWQFPLVEQVDYLESIARAGCQTGKPMPAAFIDWMDWKLGEKITQAYMLPYNRKIFSCDLNTLGTYWMSKLPDVSFREVLISCLTHAPHGQLPAHAAFYYPRAYGYGEVFRRLAASLAPHIVYGYEARHVDADTRTVNGEYSADTIVNTIPWSVFADGLPGAIQALIQGLSHTAVDIDYIQSASDTDAHWTYFADEALSYHRIIRRDNIIEGARGYWTETNAKRRAAVSPVFHAENPYAYPLNTLDKPARMAELLAWMAERRVYGLGRWGEWEHMNSDVAIDKGLCLAEDLWQR